MTDSHDVMARPTPLPSPVSQPFWDGLARHEVWIQYSPSLDRYIFYPRVLAPGTLADDLVWRQIPGTGTLVSFTVAQRPVAPQFADAVPQLLAVVAFDEGPRLATELVDVDTDSVRIGMRVRPVFADRPEAGVTMLYFTADR